MSKDKEKVVTKNARSKLGKEKYEELLEKDWKKAKIPKNYDKRRGRDGRKLNPKSLQNLTQYRDRTKKEKEIALGQLRFKEKIKKEEKKAKAEADDKQKNLLNKILETIPLDSIFEDQEVDVFKDLLETYLKDFEEEELSALDIDDIISLAMNRVQEVRLLQYGKETPSKMIDASQSIERLRKNTEKLKDSLAARRKDRVKNFGRDGMSVVDLVVMYEKNRKEMMEEKTSALLREEEAFINQRVDSGNRADPDAQILDELE
jgi:hypothetical protein